MKKLTYQYDLKRIMKRAHRKARKMVAMVGNYAVALKLALKLVWKSFHEYAQRWAIEHRGEIAKAEREAKQAKAVVPADKIAELEAQGWSRWTKGDYDRLYFDLASTDHAKISYYKSGNISSASVDGEKISNRLALDITLVKAYLDLTTGEFKINGDEEAVEIVEKYAKACLA